ncbi:hypothetical protein [Priestia megaterium]|uniref:hypothetical protein n=1 Tax=Priestia megaterium TaxID=1404 RepID=UPI001129BCE5|nr:hypothetical protein [Priestia megaterium]TPF18012.1 hypothetical protein CBE78_01950 [Priestia megaterium]TPF22119.1 hypothetical protein CBE79_04455 [Priestia megaterium]
MTKGELIKLLQDDKSPTNTKVCVYLECENNDSEIVSTKIANVKYDKSFKCLMIDGLYVEEE